MAEWGRERLPEEKSLHVGQFPPLPAIRRPTLADVWGTRGPRFKSGHPDFL
jgi:hypothetical protein